MSSRKEKYDVDPEDSLPRELVGPWAEQKIGILCDYIQASGAARKLFHRSEASYIDVFCGPGRSRIRDTVRILDGSPVAAFKKAASSLGSFSSLHISDAEPKMSDAAEQRLKVLGAPVRNYTGPATNAVSSIVKKVDPHGLHFAFIDPYNIGNLSFSLFESLAELKRIDVLAHVSVQDLQRNIRLYAGEDMKQFDNFAPGWRSAINPNRPQQTVRAEIFMYWSNKIQELGMPRANFCELVTGEQQQRLYWLIFMSKSDFARSLWKKISSEAKSPTLFG